MTSYPPRKAARATGSGCPQKNRSSQARKRILRRGASVEFFPIVELVFSLRWESLSPAKSDKTIFRNPLDTIRQEYPFVEGKQLGATPRQVVPGGNSSGNLIENWLS